MKDAVLHIEEQVISAAHAVVGEELATNSEAEGNQPLQGAGNLERLVWLALHYNSRNRPSSIAAFEDGDTSVKCVCVWFWWLSAREHRGPNLAASLAMLQWDFVSIARLPRKQKEQRGMIPGSKRRM